MGRLKTFVGCLGAGAMLLGCSRAPSVGPVPLGAVPSSSSPGPAGTEVAEVAEVTLSGDAMGTRFVVHLTGPVEDQERMSAAVHAAFAEARRIEALVNMWSSDSALQQWNLSDAESRSMPRELALLVELAIGVHGWTDGALDQTVAIALDELGFYGAPARVDAAALDPATQDRWSKQLGVERIQIDWRAGTPPLSMSPLGDWEHTGSLLVVGRELDAARTTSDTVPVTGPMLDLSALAKGYAADQIVRMLSAESFTSIHVEAGASTLVAQGMGPFNELGWQVELPNGASTRTLHLKNGALSTSGRTSLTIGDVAGGASHQFDPRTLAPVDHATEMVVVEARYGWLADALSTALLVMGADEGQRWCATHPMLVSGWGFYSIQDGAPKIEWGGSLAE